MNKFDNPIQSAAHKLKSPLSVIYSSADLLLNGVVVGDLTHEQRDLLLRIFKQAEQGIKTVEELLGDGA